MIVDNVQAITQRISKACDKCGRRRCDVSLVCVTKEAAVARMEEALEAGVTIFGENRVQDALAKHKVISDRASWHLIGHLQTNKAKDAVRIFDLIHSVDSLRLAQEIDKQAGKIGKVQDILIQVNTSGEASKFGIGPEEAAGLIRDAGLLKNISIKGLMTIAPEVEDPETVRPYFTALRELRDSIDRSWQLSMGMSNDFEVAVEEGATLVRVGRAVFT